jgi:hypothetical protein
MPSDASSSVFKDWRVAEHPRRELLLARPDINLLWKSILQEFFEEPQCSHSVLPRQFVHHSEN